jgi:hypothetical protein
MEKVEHWLGDCLKDIRAFIDGLLASPEIQEGRCLGPGLRRA